MQTSNWWKWGIGGGIAVVIAIVIAGVIAVIAGVIAVIAVVISANDELVEEFVYMRNECKWGIGANEKLV